jgi:hypothetical protein
MTNDNNTDKWFIFDLDGTLANIDDRRNLAKANAAPGKSMDWKTFQDPAVVKKDKPNSAVIKMAQVLAESGHMIAIFSGRTDKNALTTKHWLVRNNVPWHSIRMRPSKGSDSSIGDEILKENWLNDFADKVGFDNIVGVFDDRNKVVDMWRRRGLTCFQVNDGNF